MPTFLILPNFRETAVNELEEYRVRAESTAPG